MKIKIENTVITVPESFDEIKLGDYERWYLMEPSGHLEMTSFVAEVCNTDAKTLLDLPVDVFTEILEIIGFVFEKDFKPKSECTIDDVKFVIDPHDRLTLGEYIDADTIIKSDDENKLSGLLAVVCRPEGEAYDSDKTEERTEMFKNITCGKVLPLIAFFLLKKTQSAETMNRFLTVTDRANRFLKDTETFVRVGGGIKRLPIWQRIKYIYLTKSLKRELRKCSRFYSTKWTNRRPRTININLKNR